jgi:hypothetical protein
MPTLHARSAERRKLGKVVEERALKLKEELARGRVTTMVRVESPCMCSLGKKEGEKE